MYGRMFKSSRKDLLFLEALVSLVKNFCCFFFLKKKERMKPLLQNTFITSVLFEFCQHSAGRKVTSRGRVSGWL